MKGKAMTKKVRAAAGNDKMKIKMVIDIVTGQIDSIQDDEGKELDKKHPMEATSPLYNATAIVVARTNPCIWFNANGTWYYKCWK